MATATRTRKPKTAPIDQDKLAKVQAWADNLREPKASFAVAYATAVLGGAPVADPGKPWAVKVRAKVDRLVDLDAS
jgi:hypothetical protein